ncbi:hypothetical protein [Legionella cardiaca]|uniref:Uncharacterized protein n=1 Tax=Legionella cardiaca TaxID=1071983 RepID=A0ABY8ASZ7_9GAMM|nr:hypothetical protein [Legionella cardiaca]WED42901.1 hypothetical protein PXX05_13510 [Legionella cardiaca]
MKNQAQTNDKKVNISNNLVATRREELIRAGFHGLGPKLISEKQLTNKEQLVSAPQVFPKTVTPEKGLKEKEVASEERLVHLTRSRASMPKRRLPTRKARSSLSSNSFFNTPQELQSPQSIDNLLKNAIISAEEKYRDHYLHGTNAREENGWFSWLRHRMTGQTRAETLRLEIQADTASVILAKFDDFFSHPNTRYNNHSFATYLLDELNALLKKSNLKTYAHKAGEHYDLRSWYQLKEALDSLIVEQTVKTGLGGN